MPKSYTTDHLREVFTFPFKDQNWLNKFLVAIGLSLVSFLILPYFFLLGYVYELMRRIIVEREPPALPEWDDWGLYFTNGFKFFALSIIYTLPGIILMYVPQFFFIFGIEMMETASPESMFPLIGMPIFFLFMGLGMLWMYGSMLVLVVSSSHMVAEDEFGAAFRFREMWPVFKKNAAGYLIAFVVLLGVYTAIIMVSQVLVFSVILCCLYPVVLMVSTTYLMFIGSAFFAQAYAEGVDRLEGGAPQMLKSVDGEDGEETPAS